MYKEIRSGDYMKYICKHCKYEDEIKFSMATQKKTKLMDMMASFECGKCKKPALLIVKFKKDNKLDIGYTFDVVKNYAGKLEDADLRYIG